jgi:peptidoglycan/LPS O-acetylase OafA/YrhL
MKYRKEIDGLRALAIIPVILFHTGFTIFSGGFVGVDIFFVISGYLITTIIVAEMKLGSFSLLNFYERRARRILPALFFVMLCTLPFAYFYMLPNELKDYSKSLIAVPLFVSNILFYLTAGYFDVTAELKPLLHTWSLAVEEQYYALFPLLLMLLWKLGKKWILSSLVLMAIISILVAHWGSVKHPTFTFYSLQTRGFEILIGALISLYISRKSSIISISQYQSLSSIAGLGMILYSIFAFDKNTPSPSLYSLIPTIGASLILISANNKNFVGKLLGNKFFVGIGLISYSAYLWHQPIIAFSKLRNLFGLQLLNPFLIIGTSLVLAYLSYKFIEKPFRNKNNFSSKFILYFFVIATLAFITIGSVIYLGNGFRNVNDRVPPNVKWLSLSEKINTNGDICAPVAYEKSGISTCNFGDLSSDKNIILYGDSHAEAISEQLNKMFIELKIKGTKITLNGCEVVPELRIYSKINTDVTDRCMNNFSNMLSYIKKHKAEVIVVSRWSFKLYPIRGQIDNMTTKNEEGGIENEVDYREYVSVIDKKVSFSGSDKKIALNHFLDGLLSVTNKLYLIYPVPEISWDIARKNILYFRNNGTVLNEISIPYSDFKNRNKFVNSIFNEYEKNPTFISIKPENIFCDTYIKDRCVAQYGSIPYYYDDDHLSDVGANLILEKLKEKFK